MPYLDTALVLHFISPPDLLDSRINPKRDRLLGDVLRCINSINSPGGCGTSENCKNCRIRKSLIKTAGEKKDIWEIETAVDVNSRANPEKVWLRISTGFLSFDDGERIVVTLEDISSQKKIYKDLKDNEERYRNIFSENKAVMLLIHPGTGRIFDANPAAANYYGWTLEELKNRNIKQINILDDAEVKEEMRNAVEENRNHFFFRHRIANGSLRDVEVYSGPMKIGGTIMLLSIIHDITDRRFAEEELRKSEVMARALLNANTESIFLIDRGGIFLTMNEVTARRLGRSKEELIGKNYFHFLPPDLAQAKRNVFEKVLETKQAVRSEDRQSGLVLDNNAFPILDEEGRVTHIAFYSRDVTNQKSAEMAIRLSEEKYKFIANKTADVIYRVDLLTERYTYASPSVENIFGYTQEECLKLHAKDLLTEKGYETQRKILEVSLRERRTTPELMELELVRKDGRVVTAEINASLIFNDSGVPVEIMGIARDISVRKAAEEEKERLIRELRDALGEIKTLSDLIPICSRCKNIRDDKGYRKSLEAYFEKHSSRKFSHSLCPECAKELYGDQEWFDDLDGKE